MSRFKWLGRRPFLGGVVGVVAGLAGCNEQDTDENSSTTGAKQPTPETPQDTETTQSQSDTTTEQQQVPDHTHANGGDGGTVLNPRTINEVRYASSFDSIQAALDDLPTGEWGQLIIDQIADPPYILDDPVVLDSFRVLEFREDIRLDDGVLQEGGSGFRGMFNTPSPQISERLQHVRLIGRGGTIDGNRANNDAYFWGAVDFENVDDVWINGLNVINVPGPALRVVMDNNRVRVTNNRIDQSLEGIFIMAKDGWVINNDIRNTAGGQTGSGIVIGGDTQGGGGGPRQISKRVKVINNNLRDVMNGLDASNGGSHITFRDNTIEPSEGSIGIRVTNTDNARSSPSNVKIINNYVKCIGSDDVGVFLVTSESHYQIKDNWIEGAGDTGIQVGRATNCRVVDNDVTLSGGRGIWIPPGADDVTIRGNRVWNNAQNTRQQAGITLSTSNRVEVVGNTVFDDQSDPTQNWGIRDSSADGANLILERNRVYGHRTAPFDLNATRDAYWTGNEPAETHFPDRETDSDGRIDVEWPASGRGQFVHPSTKPMVDVTVESPIQWHVANWYTGSRGNYRGVELQFTDLNGRQVGSGRIAHIRIQPNQV